MIAAALMAGTVPPFLGAAVLVAPMALAALSLRRDAALLVPQRVWTGAALGGTALLAGYPWLREEPLPAYLSLLGLHPGPALAAAAVALLLVLAGFGVWMGRGWGEPLRTARLAGLAAACVALALLAGLPTAGTALLAPEVPVVLDAGHPAWEAKVSARRIGSVVVESSLSHGAALAPGTPVAIVHLARRRRPRVGLGPARRRGDGRVGGPAAGRGPRRRQGATPLDLLGGGRFPGPALPLRSGPWSGRSAPRSCASSGLRACRGSVRRRLPVGDPALTEGREGLAGTAAVLAASVVPVMAAVLLPRLLPLEGADPFRGTLTVLPLILGALREIHRWSVRLGGRRLGAAGTAGELGALAVLVLLVLVRPHLSLAGTDEVLAAGLLLVLGCRVARQTAALRPLLGDRLPRPARRILFFLLPLTVYLAILPWSAGHRQPDGDEPFYLLITHSLAYDFDADLTNNYAQGDWRHFMDRPIEPQPGDPVGPHGESSTRGTTSCCRWCWRRPTGWPARRARWPRWPLIDGGRSPG